MGGFVFEVDATYRLEMGLERGAEEAERERDAHDDEENHEELGKEDELVELVALLELLLLALLGHGHVDRVGRLLDVRKLEVGDHEDDEQEAADGKERQLEAAEFVEDSADERADLVSRKKR